MPELNRIVKSGGYVPTRQAVAERVAMPVISQEVLERIPVEYWDGLLWMQGDAAGLVDPDRIAVAVADAVRVLTGLGRRLADARFTSDQLFRIRLMPIAPGDYAANRKLRFEDDVAAGLPLVCGNCGLLWRLNGGEISHIGNGHAYFRRNGANFRFGQP